MIDILLASYNGEKYIAEQIESILNQTYTDWFLYIKDDCSTDNTINIILDYEKRYQDKIKVILSDKPTGSAKNNFFSMIQYSKNDYIMTCDQDDVWLQDKIKITINGMKHAERKNQNVPILVHTDLKVVDSELNVISESLLNMQNLDSRRGELNHLLIQNIVTGCTVMANRSLLNHITIIPRQAIMHDWWMALIASALGNIVFIEKPTMLYRQHDNNSVGAKDVKSTNYLFLMLLKISSIKQSLDKSYEQSKELHLILNNYLNEKNKNLLETYSLLYRANKLHKIITFYRYGIWKNGIIKKIGQILLC